MRAEPDIKEVRVNGVLYVPDRVGRVTSIKYNDNVILRCNRCKTEAGILDNYCRECGVRFK